MILVIVGRITQNDRIAPFFLGNGAQLFIVLPQHADIDIVIPRDKALMANASDRCSINRKILDIIFLAYADKHFQHIDLGILQLF